MRIDENVKLVEVLDENCVRNCRTWV